MSRVWFLQANPNHYDIDKALRGLERIWWRVPQYPSEIHRGDIVLIWRAGKEPGIVGIGRVARDPQLRQPDENEDRFALGLKEGTHTTTRALVQLRPTDYLAKEQVRSLPVLSGHPIIRAPMGTVFPVSEEQWTVLAPLVGEPPTVTPPEAEELPPAFSWEQRLKSVHPMPGGYESYLLSLQRVLDVVEEEHPTESEFGDLLRREFEVSERRALQLALFLRRSGFLTGGRGAIEVSDWAARWRATNDARIPIALLHSRVRFIGELLAVATNPRSTPEILQIANEQYGAGWTTQAQVGRRRGWLQSAGMVRVDESNRLVTTEDGRALLEQLTLYTPAAAPVRVGQASDAPAASIDVAAAATQVEDELDQLVAELQTSSVDSANSDRFEQAVRDAFAFLGFEAKWLGGAGRTDVLLDAPLGRDERYRVIVDCKTSRSGSVNDQQIDWMTLTEHRAKHDANHVVVVAPAPSGDRLFRRAEQQSVTVIDVEQLIGLIRQHALAPQGLDVYRKLFSTSGSLNSQVVAEDAEEWLRVVNLASAVCDALRGKSPQFGPLTARDLLLILAEEPVAEGTSEAELQGVLKTLASPLLGVLTSTKDGGYLVSLSPSSTAARFKILAASLATTVKPAIEQEAEPGS
jgi:predicted RNA-binding protein with PUA-like domain